MEEKGRTTVDSSKTATAPAQTGIDSDSNHYILPPPQRPTLDQKPQCSTRAFPVIDLSILWNPSFRSKIVEDVHAACKELGAFQVINHGIPVSFIDDALNVALEFFDLPNETKMCHASTDVHKPVRYCTIPTAENDTVQYQRGFLKHYSNPISTWIDQWPSNPPSYKKKMGNYAKAVHVLHKKLMEVVVESLGLRPGYLQEDIEHGSQVMVVNYYPACPEPNLAIGLPPHSDYGLLTIILQNQHGLEIMDSSEEWKSVPLIKEALIVQLGDQLEVLSNGRYKSAVHRAIVNSENKRISIASLHSLAIDEKVKPAQELVDEEHPLSYKEGSFRDFLNFLSDYDKCEGRFIDKLRMNHR